MDSPTKASKYPRLNSSMAVPAGGQHFYMAFSSEGEDRSCSFTTANTNPHTDEQTILPGHRAGAVLDLPGLGQKKKNEDHSELENCHTGGWSWRLSVSLGWSGVSWEVS